MDLRDDTTPDVLESLNDAIHTLAQPLTALSFVVDMALLQKSPEAWKTALAYARDETRRAVAALEEIREASAALNRTTTARHTSEGLPWEQLQ